MTVSRLQSLRIKAKLLQKARQRAGKPCALKDAYHTIATAAGFPGWQAMKATIETHELLRPPQASALWSVWYGSYAAGQAHIRHNPGFLLPYQKQYFVCDADYIVNLGVALDDPDLALVGQDWVKPADPAAWRRLLGKISRQGARV